MGIKRVYYETQWNLYIKMKNYFFFDFPYLRNNQI